MEGWAPQESPSPSPHLGFAGGSLWQLSCLKMQGRTGPGSVLEHPVLEFTPVCL